MIWCPKCYYKTVLAKFFADRCPQCGTVVGRGEALTKDPYQPQQGARSGQRGKTPDKKKFTFDQPVSDLKSIPTDTLNMYSKDK